MWKFWMNRKTKEVIEHDEPKLIPMHLAGVYVGSTEENPEQWHDQREGASRDVDRNTDEAGELLGEAVGAALGAAVGLALDASSADTSSDSSGQDIQSPDFGGGSGGGGGGGGDY